MYNSASATLKFGQGEYSKKIGQRRGIRQGSSLSPLLFIMCLDWAIKRAEAAMKNLGYSEKDWSWLAYVDDIAA